MGETSKNPFQEFSGFQEGEETGCNFLNERFAPMEEPKRRQTHVFNASIPQFVIPQFRFIYFDRIRQKRMVDFVGHLKLNLVHFFGELRTFCTNVPRD
jgi:hypothetical protein